jgi:hypothetical protein
MESSMHGKLSRPASMLRCTFEGDTRDKIELCIAPSRTYLKIPCSNEWENMLNRFWRKRGAIEYNGRVDEVEEEK